MELDAALADAAGGGVLAGLLIFFVDVNEFSMHLFYRNRLVRAYLGASNLKRNPHPFTGFALDDDLMLKDFDPQVPPRETTGLRRSVSADLHRPEPGGRR